MFEGVSGTGWCCGVLGEGEALFFLGVEGLEDFLCSEATLFTASNLVVASGGGNGEIESPETDAVCA